MLLFNDVANSLEFNNFVAMSYINDRNLYMIINDYDVHCIIYNISEVCRSL